MDLVTGVVVDRTLKDDQGRVVGVEVRMPDGESPEAGRIASSVVVLADGANSPSYNFV